MSFDRDMDNPVPECDVYAARLEHLVGLQRTKYTELEDMHVGPDGAHQVDALLEDVPWCNLHQRAYLDGGEE